MPYQKDKYVDYRRGHLFAWMKKQGDSPISTGAVVMSAIGPSGAWLYSTGRRAVCNHDLKELQRTGKIRKVNDKQWQIIEDESSSQ